jgi:hypothetical protein
MSLVNSILYDAIIRKARNEIVTGTFSGEIN